MEWIGLNQPQADPMTGQVGVQNPVAQMDVDIIIETTPDTANVAQEQFQMLAELAKAGLPIPPLALIKASSLPNKSDILDQMKAQAEQPDPAKQMAMEKGAADINKTKADTALTIAKARTEMHAPMMNAAQTAADIYQAQNPAAGGPPGASESYPPQQG